LCVAPRHRYLLEESLSVDNLFVFLLLFEYFKVPTSPAHRGAGMSHA